jgi:hypothetical protein
MHVGAVAVFGAGPLSLADAASRAPSGETELGEYCSRVDYGVVITSTGLTAPTWPGSPARTG